MTVLVLQYYYYCTSISMTCTDEIQETTETHPMSQVSIGHWSNNQETKISSLTLQVFSFFGTTESQQSHKEQANKQ